MSDEIGGLGGKPTSEITDQIVQKIGEQIQVILMAAGFTTASTQYRGVSPADLGRLICAFARIEDPRVRTECLSLIEAIGGSPNR